MLSAKSGAQVNVLFGACGFDQITFESFTIGPSFAYFLLLRWFIFLNLHLGTLRHIRLRSGVKSHCTCLVIYIRFVLGNKTN